MRLIRRFVTMTCVLSGCMLMYLSARSTDADNAIDITVVAFNVQMLPTTAINTFQNERVGSIADAVKMADVVVFSEVFDDEARLTIQQSMLPAFPYASCILGGDGDCKEGDLGVCQDGGVMILSKHPIANQQQKFFYKTDCEMSVYDRVFGPDRPECWGDDCWAKKGFIYIRILKNDLPIHIVGTHTQATYATEKFSAYQKARELQFKQIASFIRSLSIPTSEPVIIAGDLNVDMLNSKSEYNLMLETLKARPADSLDATATYDPSQNCLTEPGKSEFLDYILYCNEHRMPFQSSTVTLKLKVARPYQKAGADCDALSDHFAVMSKSRF